MLALLRLSPLIFLLMTITVPNQSNAAGLPDNAALALPDSEIPDDGWPTILLLHGWGANKEDFSDVAALCALRGVAAIAIDAPISLGENRRSWPRPGVSAYSSIEPSLDYIDGDDRFDTDRLFIGGFSQGGYQSLVVSNAHPERFSGVLSISPGGAQKVELSWAKDTPPQSLYLIYGTQEGSGILDLASDAASQWKNAGLRVRVKTHAGGHHIPANWTTELTDALEWLLETPE